jgi:hypothetical protein
MDDTPHEPITTTDMDKVMVLLKEYTGKLRRLCEDRIMTRNRDWGTFTTTSTLFIVVAGMAFILETLDLVPVGTAASVLGLIALVLAISVFRLRIRRPHFNFDAAQIASTVERLIGTASQYQEHSPQRLGDRFEFSLRLAEAEATLRMYYSVFEDRSNSTKAPFAPSRQRTT